MNEQLLRTVRRERAKSPLMGLSTALAIARSEAKTQDTWEHDRGERWRCERDGFELTLTWQTESECPKEDDDLGHYLKGVRDDYAYEWGGNYPKPEEDLPLNLPYTAFVSGSYSQDSHAYPYFVPDGIEDWYEHLRTNGGQSKSVAWDLTKAWVEDTIGSFFGDPLLYIDVTVTAYRDGIELGSSSIGTTITGYDDNYIFVCADECGLIDEALDEAKEAVERLKQDDAPISRRELWDKAAGVLRELRERVEAETDVHQEDNDDVLGALHTSLDYFDQARERDIEDDD